MESNTTTTTNTTTAKPRPRRKAGVLLIAALVAGGLTTFVAPATSASALAIDCSYDSGLSVFIGAGRDGVTCMGGGSRSPGTVFGSGTLSGQAVPGGASIGSVCTSSTPAIPDVFYGWGNISSSTASWETVREDGSKWHTTNTWYSRGGRNVASRIINTSPGKPLEMTFHDFTLVSRDGSPGVVLSSTYNCKTDDTWVVAPPQILTPTTNDVTVPAPVGAPSNSLETTASMAPIPFHAGSYFLRVDLTDNHPAPTRTGYTLNLDLSSYVIDSMVGSPRDSSCPEALTFAEHCMSPSISPGETQTYTLAVHLRPGATANAPLTILTEHDAHQKIGVVNRPGPRLTLVSVSPAA